MYVLITYYSILGQDTLINLQIVLHASSVNILKTKVNKYLRRVGYASV